MSQHKVVFWLTKASSQSTVGHSAAARKKHCPSTASNILISNWIQCHFWSKPHCLTRLTLHARSARLQFTTCSHSSCFSPRSGPLYMQTKWRAQAVLAAMSVSIGFSKFHGQMCKTKSAQTESNIFSQTSKFQKCLTSLTGDSPTFHHPYGFSPSSSSQWPFFEWRSLHLQRASEQR